MKKLLSSLATFTLLTSSTATTVVACGGSHHTTARNEANALANKTIYLNDAPTKSGTTTATYEDTTAQKDVTAIDNAITTAGYLNATQVKDFSFDDKTILKPSTNHVTYNVKAPDGSSASGTFDVVINHPSTTTTPQATTEANFLNNQTVTLKDTTSATYENQTAQTDVSAINAAIMNDTKIGLSKTQLQDFTFDNTTKLTTGTNKAVAYNVKALDGSTAKGTFNIVIDPSQKPFTPATETPQDIANKLQGKTVKLDPTSWNGKNILNYPKKFQQELVNQKLLTADEAQYVQGTSFVVGAIKNYPNLTFKVEENGVVAYAKNMTIEVTNPDYKVLDKMKNGHITLKYSEWKGRELKNNLYNYDFRQLLVKEKILTQEESNWIEANDSTVINQGPKTYIVNYGDSEWGPEAFENIPLYVV